MNLGADPKGIRFAGAAWVSRSTAGLVPFQAGLASVLGDSIVGVGLIGFAWCDTGGVDLKNVVAARELVQSAS